MTELLQRLADFSVLVFVTSSMLAMGMSQRFADVVAPLKEPKPVLLALLVNFVLSPLLTVVLSRLIPLQPAHAIGLLLLGGAAGAPFLPKLAEVSRGSLAYSVALMVLLMVGTIVFMPLALPFIIPGLEADPWSIAKPLLILMVVPLAIGFAIAVTGASWVGRLLRLVQGVSNLAFVLLLVLLIGLNLKAMAGTFGSFAIGTYAVYVLGMVGAGYLLGGSDRTT